MRICRYGKEAYIHDVTKLLIEKGIDINRADTSGRNALMFTCLNKGDVNFAKIVTLLLDKGIDVNHTTESGWNALMFIRNYGIDFSAQDKHERNAIYYLREREIKPFNIHELECIIQL